MNCYDCAMEEKVATAVAVCRRCGAGVCVTHAHVTRGAIHRAAGTGLSESHAQARHIACGVCHHAEVSG
ncbi:DUF2180 family protein [Streptomyces sp. NPDC004856]|uniref:DUF2180 family protein n=1 Tax=unclassified Streptomyces TaxID=2593676 RepID=UPI0033B420D9